MRVPFVVLGLLLMLFGGGCILTAWNFATDFAPDHNGTVWRELWSIAAIWLPLGIGPIGLGIFLILRAKKGGGAGSTVVNPDANASKLDEPPEPPEEGGAS